MTASAAMAMTSFINPILVQMAARGMIVPISVLLHSRPGFNIAVIILIISVIIIVCIIIIVVIVIIICVIIVIIIIISAV